MIAVQGPKALELCRGLTAGRRRPARLLLRRADALPRASRASSAAPATPARTAWSSWSAPSQAVSCGRSWSARGARPCGLGARDTLRLEAAMPLYGHELSEEIDPFQAGLGWAVKLDKGDFIGRDGPAAPAAGHRRCRGASAWSWRASASPAKGRPCSHGGQAIGRVTSGTFAPTAGQGHRHGLCRSGHDRSRAPPARWTCAARPAPARVVPLAVLPQAENAEPLAAASGETSMDPEKAALRRRPTSGPASRATSAPSASRKFAVDQLTDIVYIELPDVGDHVFAGDSFGEIESVKAVSDLYAPVDGEVDRRQREAAQTIPTIITERPLRQGLDDQDQGRAGHQRSTT